MILGIKWKVWKRFVMLGLLYYDLLEIDRINIRKFAILKHEAFEAIII